MLLPGDLVWPHLIFLLFSTVLLISLLLRLVAHLRNSYKIIPQGLILVIVVLIRLVIRNLVRQVNVVELELGLLWLPAHLVHLLVDPVFVDFLLPLSYDCRLVVIIFCCFASLPGQVWRYTFFSDIRSAGSELPWPLCLVKDRIPSHLPATLPFSSIYRFHVD